MTDDSAAKTPNLFVLYERGSYSRLGAVVWRNGGRETEDIARFVDQPHLLLYIRLEFPSQARFFAELP